MAYVSDDEREYLISLIREEILEVNTSLPAIIISYSGGLASVRPIGTRKLSQGSSLNFPLGSIKYPIIYNVPVVWPRFAMDTAGVKGPITPGSKCNLQFSQRALDEFMGFGDDTRNHDLNDAVAVMGVYPKALSVFSNNNDDMIMYYGTGFIKVKSTGFVEINDDTDNAVNFSNLKAQFNELKDAFNALVTAFSMHTHPVNINSLTALPTTTIANSSVANIDLCKILSIKVPSE